MLTSRRNGIRFFSNSATNRALFTFCITRLGTSCILGFYNFLSMTESRSILIDNISECITIITVNDYLACLCTSRRIEFGCGVCMFATGCVCSCYDNSIQTNLSCKLSNSKAINCSSKRNSYLITTYCYGSTAYSTNRFFKCCGIGGGITLKNNFCYAASFDNYIRSCIQTNRVRVVCHIV